MASILLGLTVSAGLYISWRRGQRLNAQRSPCFAVVVLGDIGRSPRMRNHALEIARTTQAQKVYLIGYVDSTIPSLVLNHPKIVIVPVRNERYNSLPLFIRLAMRLCMQTVSVAASLMTISGLRLVIIQNPPSVPIGYLIRLLCWIRGALMLIDCHNYGFSLLKLQPRIGLLWPLLKILEFLNLALADKVFCVSEAMQRDLEQKIHQRPIVLRDQPPAHFHVPSRQEKEKVLKKYFTTEDDGRQMVVTSTSYTADENLPMLIQALVCYVSQPEVPKIRLVITGKGPLRDSVTEKWQETCKSCPRLNEWVDFHQIFCDVDDYPMLIGSANLGVSLHESSSGVDLPMKVVDLIGVGVPVISFDFPAITELLGDKAHLFKNAQELSKVLTYCLLNPPQRPCIKHSWEFEWEAKALPEFEKSLQW